MKYLPLTATLLIAIILSGCYNMEVTTDKQPSGEVYENNWVTGFIGGLIIVDSVDASMHCPNGVARVETELTFANQFVSFLTGGLYSPMAVRVACAAADASINTDLRGKYLTLGEDSNLNTVQNTLQNAAYTSAFLQEPVYVSLK